MSRLYVATANTHFGRMLDTPGGFEAIQHADVLLMQEVLAPSDRVQQRLEVHGFQLVHSDASTGLAVALATDGQYEAVHGSEETTELSPAVWGGASASESRLIQRMRARAAIGVTLRHAYTHTEFMVATAHPVVPARPIARSRQVRGLGRWLSGHPAENIILGADMNHYPAPRHVDRELEVVAGMRRVDIGDEVTWRMEGSNSELVGRIASKFTRRDLADFDGQLDAMLYRGALAPVDVGVEDVASDHRAIMSQFELAGSGLTALGEGRP